MSLLCEHKSPEVRMITKSGAECTIDIRLCTRKPERDDVSQKRKLRIIPGDINVRCMFVGMRRHDAPPKEMADIFDDKI